MILDKVKWGHHNQAYIAELTAMSDADLFEEMIEKSVPDDHDGGFTGWGQFQQEASEIVYRDRKGYGYRPDNYALFNTLMDGPDTIWYQEDLSTIAP